MRATLALMDRSSYADVLAQPTRARLYALMQASSQPLDTVQLAGALGLHPNGVRAHLEQMRAAGLITRARARAPQQRGRPRDIWLIAPGVPDGPHIAELPPPARAGSAALPAPPPGGDEAYRRLAVLRSSLRSYLAWAEDKAREHGLTAAQFQLALAVHVSAGEDGPTMTELADALLLRHHSVVGLVDRAEEAGVVERVRHPEQPSRVHVRLTDEGVARFRMIADQHLQELAQLAPHMQALWGAFAPGRY